MTGDYETLTLEKRDDVAVLTLNRPERLNAMSPQMFAEIPRAWAEVEADDGVRAAVLTGAGRGFCAGADLETISSLQALGVQGFYDLQERAARSVAATRHVTKPVIAAVNGPAAGGGFALALAADVRLAAPTAGFNAAFVRLGLSAGDIGFSWLLPRVVGLGHAAELMLTGDVVDAQEAARIGLVNRVVEAEALLDESLALAARMNRNSPFGLKMTKQVLQSNVDAPSLEAAIELENRTQALCVQTEDMAEAAAAFVEKRPAQFTGR